jgi:hypothetical protein
MKKKIFSFDPANELGIKSIVKEYPDTVHHGLIPSMWDYAMKNLGE